MIIIIIIIIYTIHSILIQTLQMGMKVGTYGHIAETLGR